MKRKIFFALAAVLMLGFVACNKDDDKKDNGNNGNASLVGTWKISAITSNGQDMSAMLPDDLQITMNANGSGAINMYGTDYAFTWTATATTLKVDNGDQVTNCTIVSLTANECILTSDNMIFPGMQEPLPYTVTITLTRIGGGGDNNNYSTLIVGTWQMTQTLVNGQDYTEQSGNIKLVFNANGRGVLNDNGETEHNDYGWVINGSTISITPDHGSPATFTIVSLDGHTCVFTGSRMPGIEQDLGEVRITMVKEGDNPNPDPVDGELAGTAWAYITDTTVTETVEGSTMEISTQGSVTTTFTTTTQGTLAINITVAVSVNGVPMPNYGRTINDSVPFTYTYDPATRMGTLTARGVDGDDTNVSFTYDPSRNVIIAVNNSYDSESDMLPQTIIFSRIR